MAAIKKTIDRYFGELNRADRQQEETDAIEVLADRGYFKGEEIAACEHAGIEVYVPRPMTSNARAQGRYDRGYFFFDKERNGYVCPAGEDLTYRMTSLDTGRVMHRYWASVCDTCALKRHCTPSNEHRVARWEHEDILEQMQKWLDRKPDAMIIRRCTVEHSFGTIKSWMGATHFQMKTQRHVATEMALHMLAYNMKGVIAIIGVPELLRAIAAFLAWLSAAIAHQRGIWLAQKPNHAI